MKKIILSLFLIYSGCCFGHGHQDSTKESNYLFSLAQGDSCFLVKNYTKAKEFFVRAAELKPNENYPKLRIAECDNMIDNERLIILKQKLLDSQYKNNILKGEQCRSNKKYKEAKAFYKEALKLKPSEQYPKDKIKEMDNLINLPKNK